MSEIKPFRALRPRPEYADKVSCIPYDVPYEAEVRSHIEANPVSFLRVTRPEAEFAVSSGAANGHILERSRENLSRFVDDGIMVQDAEPSVYIYRIRAGGHTQTGVVACCSLEEYESGLIKKHEKTQPDKVRDRTEHMVALRAQTGLILLAFRHTERIRRSIEKETSNSPVYDRGEGDFGQTIWRVEDPDELVSAFVELDALYIADGHHRIESALLARNEIEQMGAKGNEHRFVMAGMFPAEDLRILAYNRAVKDLNGMTDEEFISKLKTSFQVSETGDPRPDRHGDVCMYMSGRWHLLRYDLELDGEADPIERLDVTILQRHVLKGILGIDDPRTSDRIVFVGGRRGTEELIRLVDAGEAKVAFSMYPTTMDDLFAVSDAGEIMPPKSTWFEPKLKDGLFVHLI